LVIYKLVKLEIFKNGDCDGLSTNFFMKSKFKSLQKSLQKSPQKWPPILPQKKPQKTYAENATGGRIVSTYGFLPKFVWTFSAFQKKNCTAVDVFSQFSELFSLSFELSVSVKTIVVQPKLHYYILLERLIV
jgi:hypothetical protein